MVRIQALSGTFLEVKVNCDTDAAFAYYKNHTPTTITAHPFLN